MPGKGEKQVPIGEGVFTWPSDDPRLIGSKCNNCGKVAFPAQNSCPSCCLEDVDKIELSKRGKLWTWTLQGFLPKSPPYAGPENEETFVPYGVGYVELPGEVRVESRLTENDPDKLKIGMEMELVIQKFIEDEEGNDVMAYFFKPVEE
ncbi:Zn-ribbon domain-containing OB-fold protein [Thermodesulfobacteriota bacterium]